MVCETVAPGPIVPKSRLRGVTAICGGSGVTPEPVAVMLVGEFKALLGNVMVVDTVPADCGVNDTETVTALPAAIVTGKGTPPTVKPALTVGAPTVALDVPVFDNCTLWVAVVPVLTLP